MRNEKKKACLLLNMVSPARIPLYSALADYFDLLVLHGGTEANRKTWRGDAALTNARVKRAWGWQIAQVEEHNGKSFDQRFTHITPGYIQGLLQFHPDVIITNEMGLRTLIALLYGTLFGVPVWVWWGGTMHTERKNGFARKFVRKIIASWARHWISYGHSSTTYLKSLGIKESSILEIQNGVDEERFLQNTEKEFEIRPHPVLLHVGQLVGRKGLDHLLNAVSDLQHEGLDFSLLLVGGGRDENTYRQMARDLKLNKVHFCYELPPERMPGVYRSADVCVFPTIHDVWGLVANEAILSDIPVLCSKYAGCAEEIIPQENIFDPHDHEEFKQKLRQAVAGKLSKSDPSCLRTTSQLAGDLIYALESSLPGPHTDFRERSNEYPHRHAERTPHENMSRP